jgi:hypothetical protein
MFIGSFRETKSPGIIIGSLRIAKLLNTLVESPRGAKLLFEYPSLSPRKGRLRGAKPLFQPFPLPLLKGKGDKGGWGSLIISLIIT